MNKDNIQQSVNTLCAALRKQVIETLIAEDFMRFRAPIPTEAELKWTTEQIFKMHCPTRQLRKLFRDVHQMQSDKNQYQRPACVAELEWCLDNRSIGYPTSLRVKHGWLPAKEDADLRKLPAFVALTQVYIANGQKAIPPVNKTKVISEATQIINQIQFQKV